MDSQEGEDQDQDPMYTFGPPQANKNQADLKSIENELASIGSSGSYLFTDQTFNPVPAVNSKKNLRKDRKVMPINDKLDPIQETEGVAIS
jgi:hypothetical protein